MVTETIEIPLTSKNNNEVLGGAQLRRNSTGIIGFENNDPKILSRYLRARTESCHDFCKYGTNDRFEATQKSLALKSITSPRKLPPVANNANKKKFIVRKPSLDFDTWVPHSPRVSKIDASLSSPKKALLPKYDSSLPGKGGEKATKPLPTRLSLVSSEQQIRDKRIGDIRKNKKTGARLEAKEVQASTEKIKEKALNLNDLDNENKVDESTPNEGPTIQSSASTTSTLDGKGTRTRLAKPAASSSESKNARTTNKRLRRQNRTQIPSWSPYTFTRSHSESTLTEESSTVSEQNETKTTSSSHKKGRPTKRVGIINTLEQKKQPPPRNLHFKEGKAIAVEPENNNNARRVKFRKGKVQVNGNKMKQEKVVLKHQDMEEKKECQSLFNNVIEETAGKLVKTRKSKVKALVGAFETLISLQDIKPVAVTSIC